MRRRGLFTWHFWKDALERSISTGIQFGIGMIPASTILIQQIRWDIIGGGAAFGFVICLAKCVMASRFGRSDSASFAD